MSFKSRVLSLLPFMLLASMSGGGKSGGGSSLLGHSYGNGEFIPMKHPIATTAHQKRQAKKRRNIRARAKH